MIHRDLLRPVRSGKLCPIYAAAASAAKRQRRSGRRTRNRRAIMRSTSWIASCAAEFPQVFHARSGYASRGVARRRAACGRPIHERAPARRHDFRADHDGAGRFRHVCRGLGRSARCRWR